MEAPIPWQATRLQPCGGPLLSQGGALPRSYASTWVPQSPAPIPSSSALPAAALALFAAASWLRPAQSRPGSGRVVVYGRNYETNIKKKKGPAEIKKARITRKHLNKIILCVREGGADEANNPQLSRVIKAALKENVPRSTIDKRIKKFVDDKEVVEEMVLGGYAAGGTAILVNCTTDSTVRTRTEVREAFKAASGQIGSEGCVDHMFTKQGVLKFKDIEEDGLMEKAMEADIEIEDVLAKEDGTLDVITLPENFHSASKAFEAEGLEPYESDVVFEPNMTSAVQGENAYEVKHLLHLLGELEDVQDIHHTAELPDDIEVKFNFYGIPLSYESAQKAK